MRRFIFLLATMLFILQSCSIQKRHYLPGYHIEWNGQKESDNLIEPLASEVKKQSVACEPSTPALQASEIDSSDQPETGESTTMQDVSHGGRISTETKAHHIHQPIRPIRLLQADNMVSSLGSISPSHSIPEDAKEVETAAILSFVFAILFFAMPFISSLWAIIGLIFPLLAIIQGAIAMYRIKRDPNLKGKGLAIAGFVLGIIGLLMIAFLFLLVIFAFPL